MGISCRDSYYYYVLQFHGGRLTIRVTGTGSGNDRGVLPFDGYDNLQLMDGGSAADAQTVAYGEKAKAPAAPVRPGYVFGAGIWAKRRMILPRL